MIAIIPCAGRGTRRRPDTNFTPKILLEYPNPPSPPCQGGMKGEHQGGRKGDPLIEHIVRPIDMSERFEKLVFVLSPRTGHQIIDYIRRNPLETPHAFVWQNEPLGFGHAVLQARDEVFTPLGFPPRAGGLRGMWNPLRSVSPRPVLIATDDGVRNPASPDKPSFDLIREMVGSSISTLGVQWRGDVKNHGMVIVREGGEARRRGSGGAREKPEHLPRPNSPSEKVPILGMLDGIGTRQRESEGSGEKNSHTHHVAPTQTQPIVERLIEKPYWDEGGLVMTGLYYVRESRRLFRCLHKLVKSGRCLGGEFQFTHALQMMIDAGTEFRTHYHEWVDAGGSEEARERGSEGARKRGSEEARKRENGK